MSPAAVDEGDGEELDDAVVYDLSDWDDAQRSALEQSLLGEGVSFHWDRQAPQWPFPGAVDAPAGSGLQAELAVAEGDADLVEALIDELDHPDALEAEDDDGGDAGAGVLSSLYVAADVLVGAPGQAQAAEELCAAAAVAREAPTPYGLDPAVWAELGRLAGILADLLGQGAEEDAVVSAARLLRQAVHPLV